MSRARKKKRERFKASGFSLDRQQQQQKRAAKGNKQASTALQLKCNQSLHQVSGGATRRTSKEKKDVQDESSSTERVCFTSTPKSHTFSLIRLLILKRRQKKSSPTNGEGKGIAIVSSNIDNSLFFLDLALPKSDKEGLSVSIPSPLTLTLVKRFTLQGGPKVLSSLFPRLISLYKLKCF